MNAKVWLIVGCLLVPPLANASEFGNVYGSPEIEKASRQASSSALEAIENILRGLLERESLQGNGSDQFRAAADLLLQARAEFGRLLEMPDLPDRPISEVEASQLAAGMDSELVVASIRRAKTSKALLFELQQQSSVLAEAIGALADSRQPIYPQISARLRDYMALAEAVTVVNLPR
ncbi:hypothetical protein ACDY96_17860 [Rhizobium mongolense]|uniref:hypothetical protein n=1 Tax=Rhizobium mongolense TaxID=57676 RepID=UPI00355842AA